MSKITTRTIVVEDDVETITLTGRERDVDNPESVILRAVERVHGRNRTWLRFPILDVADSTWEGEFYSRSGQVTRVWGTYL